MQQCFSYTARNWKPAPNHARCQQPAPAGGDPRQVGVVSDIEDH